MTDRKKIYCNTCKNETNHILEGSHQRYHSVEADIYFDGGYYDVFSEDWLYEFWVCLGCDTATMLEHYHCNNIPKIDGTTYFPDRLNSSKRNAKKFLHTPSSLMTIYKEIISAYQQEMNLLCAIGLRALLEGICISEGINDEVAYNLGPGKNPQKKPGKLNKLKDECNISQEIIDSLCKMVVFGNDAVHKLEETSRHDISRALDLIEALLTTLYEAKVNLENKAKMLHEGG